MWELNEKVYFCKGQSGVEKLVFERDVKASKLTGNTSISSVNNIMSTERFFHSILTFTSEGHRFWVWNVECAGKIDTKV